MPARLLVTASLFALHAFLLPAAGRAHEEEFRGRVVEVLEGDTIKVLRDGKPEIVRLVNVDAPEKGQPYFESARKFVERVCLNEEVRVISLGRDPDNRLLLGTVHEEDGMNVSFEIVRIGLAWNYKHFEHDRTLAELETAARKGKHGLWAESRPTPPWEYRQQHQMPEQLSADNVPKRR